MELGCDGQLYALMSAKKVFSEESTSFVTKGLLEAIDYLHRNRILHRDLKPENIVLIMVRMTSFRVMSRYAISDGPSIKPIQPSSGAHIVALPSIYRLNYCKETGTTRRWIFGR